MRSRNLPRAWLFDFSRLNSLVLGHVDMVMSVTLAVNDLLWNLSQKKIPSFYSLTWFCGLSTTSHGPPQQVDGYMSCGQCSCWSHVKWSDCIIYVNSDVSNCGSVCFHVCISVQVIYCAILLLRISWSEKKAALCLTEAEKKKSAALRSELCFSSRARRGCESAGCHGASHSLVCLSGFNGLCTSSSAQTR